MKSEQVTILLVIGGVLLLGYLAKKGAGAAVDAAKAAGSSVNPLNADNVPTQVVNGLGGAIATGRLNAGSNGDWSLGSQIYDWLHANNVDPMYYAKSN